MTCPYPGLTKGGGQARIQDSEGGGGVRTSEGGVSYRNFRSGSKLLQGPGQINKQKKLQTAVGGVSDHPKKPLYPRMGGGSLIGWGTPPPGTGLDD